MTGIDELFAELDGYQRYEVALAAFALNQSKPARAARAEHAGWRHGQARYALGCRCDVCRAANTAYMREYQRRRAKEPAFRAKRRQYDKARRAARKAAA